jgi:hypothetical protein
VELYFGSLYTPSFLVLRQPYLHSFKYRKLRHSKNRQIFSNDLAAIFRTQAYWPLCFYFYLVYLKNISFINNNNNNNNHGSTALYGLGPPLSEVTWSCAFVAVGDHSTGRARAIWRLGWEMAAKFRLRALLVLFMPVLLLSFPPKEVVLRIFITLKNPSTSLEIEPANLGSSGEHANH